MTEAPAPHRILVVEDDDNIATALEYVVRKAGLTCDRVAKGSDAMGRIHSFHPDLVLLDIMLPEVSGYDICDTVRRDPDLQRLKILMMTARGSANEARRALEHGADGFITKPFDLTTLRGEISRLLGSAA